MAELAKLREEKRRGTMTEKLSTFKFSEGNKEKGVVLEKDFGKLVDFALSLNDKQFQKFSEIMTGIVPAGLSQKFSEEGSGGDGTVGDADSEDVAIDAEAKKMVKEGNAASYSEAVRLVAAKRAKSA